MENSEIKKRLIDISKKMAKNTTNLWNDNLQNTTTCVILDDAKKDRGIIKFNKWSEDLEELIVEL